MITASVDENGMLNILSRDKESVRLGSGAGDMKFLSADAMERGIKTLKAFAKIAENYNSKIRAVATSAVREAENKDEFVHRVFEETGISLEVVAGNEEARLIYMGVLHSLPIYNKKALLIDIGGGSTETVVGKQGKTHHINSVKLGTIRLSQLFFNKPETNEEQIESCIKYIKGNWTPVLEKIEQEEFDIMVGTSGTIQNIALMTLARNNKPIPENINGIEIHRKDFLKTIDSIKNCKNNNERAALPGIDAKREDIILPGALIIERAIKELKIKKIIISNFALREGIVFDTIQKEQAIIELHHLSSLRLNTIKNLCKRYNIDIEHSKHVKKLAISLFDDLMDLHGLEWHSRELLEAACYLHDVGFHISHDGHHKHSYYIIKNCIMPGFTSHEQEIIALIARYHRKSHPKNKHLGYNALETDTKNVVWILASLLRIAEGLDRRQQKYIKKIRTKRVNGNVVIYITPESKDIDPDIEIWGALRRTSMLEEKFKIKVQIEKE